MPLLKTTLSILRMHAINCRFLQKPKAKHFNIQGKE